MLPENEPLISLQDVPKLPRLAALRGGHGVSIVSIYRWISVGVCGVKLEATRIGGRIATSAAAVDRFINKLNGVPAAAPSRNQRDAEIDKAASDLRKQTARRRRRPVHS